MLQKLGHLLQTLSRSRTTFDPSQFDDPVALKTQWGPLVKGGTNFCTRKMVTVSPGRIEFKPTVAAYGFSSTFFLAGIIVLFFSFLPVFKGEATLAREQLFVTLFSLVFIAVGGWLYASMTRPIIFDMMAGFFWKGRVGPHQTFHPERIKVMTALDALHALQIVSEQVTGNKSRYTSYELNLILGDGHRLNVVDHGNYRKLRRDAEHLAQSLGVPLWDVAR